MNQQFTRWPRLGAIIVCAGLLIAGGASAQEKEKAQLAELQAELKARQQKLAASQASAEELQAVLKESEVQIGRVASKLNRTEEQLSTNRAEQKSLQAEQATLREAILKQQSLLSKQLRSAFMAGHYDYAKMMFYQDDARTFERVLTYYQYVSKARQQAITEFRSNVDRLEAVTAQLAEKASALEQLLAEQRQQRAALVARQDDRKQTLARLNATIRSEAARVEELQASEQSLMAAIEEAQRRAEQATATMDGLSGRQGKLLLPAEGRVRKLFGNRRQGQVRWKGIVIEGDEGSAVKAVSGGRILYADWLKGFGLVTIIDHGKGYMSVYGHNQALLRQAGDTVGAGDTIALVGQSGGQSYPNLYFEIRHKGKALNPSRWLNL
ncbi:peptidoglycan DD-metalloendopeptidase family protein [Alteromonas sp. ASW11-19]|uniref:Peptidoglycan DD-metalloendopeptidase family protein n=1 Tax=Alteromonas salexigens TaxID=2982530 RepID=A0ABT2VJ89_9ALTE|nr:peptidoglycan DD-metalloendopeptidase family protein [Alteromonas salexigens]MCU7553285.1 peptidoglycan DD-metalloendopeptidase family protein [Alteromonas salexigens]